MRVHVDTNSGAVWLEEAENFRALDARIVGDGPLDPALSGRGHRVGEHLWLAVQALAALAGERPEGWHAAFGKMIDLARGKGWLDPQGHTVRVHIAG